MAAPTRALLGFAAAVISVLTFHQAMWALLHIAGIMPAAAPNSVLSGSPVFIIFIA